MDSCCVCGYSQGGPMWGTGRKIAPKRHPRMLLSSCIGVAVLLFFPSASAVRQTGNKSSGTSLAAHRETEVKSLVCPDPTKGEREAPTLTTATVTLSEAQPSVSLQCGGATTVVPKDLATGKVCPGDLSGDIQKCKEPAPPRSGEGGKSTVSLSELMGGLSTNAVTWETQSAGKGDATGGTIYNLALPTAPLPLLDGTFLAGCLKTEEQGPLCALTVNVEARKSAASGQIVSCAYGKKSNPADKRPIVTISRQKNTLTLACGYRDATTVPKNLSEFCMEASVPCTKTGKFETLIPGFQPSWWVKNEHALTWTLTIPKDKVPTSPQTIYLGCHYQSESAKEDVRTTTACMADVIIGGEPSAAGPSGAAVSSITLVAVALSFSFSSLS